MENLRQPADGTATMIAHFSNRADAEKTVTNLKEAGFRSDQISLMVRPGYDIESISSGAKSSPSRESFWGKVKDFFEGDKENGSYSEAQKSTAAAEGSNSFAYDFDHDSFSTSLSQLDVPQERAKYFSRRFEAGEEGAIIAVRRAGCEAEAQQILKQNGGDLGENAASYKPVPEESRKSGETTQRVQLLGEVLRVHKDRIPTEEVRVRKEIVTEQQTIQVPVEREELVIERVAATGQTPVVDEIGANKVISIPLSEERVNSDKQNVVREEVTVGTRNVEATQNVTDSVRHEELRVENEDLEQGNERVDPRVRRSA